MHSLSTLVFVIFTDIEHFLFDKFVCLDCHIFAFLVHLISLH